MSETIDLTKIDFSKLSEKEITKVLQRFNLSDEEYLKIDETEFRARFRERLHHTLEIQTYSAIHYGKKLKENQTRLISNLVDLWRRRGISEELPDFKTAQRVLEFAQKSQNGETVDLSAFVPHKVTGEEYSVYDKIVKERRSVRHWTDEEVSDEIIDKVLDSGLWAAHSCNLQSIRYAVIREKNAPGLFKGGDIPPGPVHLLVLQDERVYRANPLNPERNRLLDAGAAAQNIVLTAHALGLGGVWLTFTPPVFERLYDFLKLPEHYKLVTYVDVGWPAQTPAPLLRLGLEETLLRRV